MPHTTCPKWDRNLKGEHTMRNASYRDMTGPDGLIANRVTFTGNSLWAEWTTMRPAPGMLDHEEWERLSKDWRDAIDAEVEMYVVYSYRTPIAWALKGRTAYCVGQRFSVTTSKGQGYVRAWINHKQGYLAYLAERERLGL